MSALRAASHNRERRGMADREEITCAVCKKSIEAGEGHFRIGDSSVHVKCYEKMKSKER
jgi:hypothetical protein